MAILVNGSGFKFVNGQIDADLFRGLTGGDGVFLQTGSNMAYSVPSANTVRILDGEFVTNEGRRIQIKAGNYDDFAIPSGSQGVTTYYFIGYRFYIGTGEQEGYELMDSCVPLSFIAVPAIRDPELTTERTLCTLDREIALDKIRQILKIGIENNHDSIVLGAWGCGIFHNPPEDIAKLFKQVLNEPGIKDYYKIVHFAIIEDSCSFNVHNPSGNFIPFKMIFDNVRE